MRKPFAFITSVRNAQEKKMSISSKLRLNNTCVFYLACTPLLRTRKVKLWMFYTCGHTRTQAQTHAHKHRHTYAICSQSQHRTARTSGGINIVTETWIVTNIFEVLFSLTILSIYYIQNRSGRRRVKKQTHTRKKQPHKTSLCRTYPP